MTKATQRFKVGDKVRLTSGALENENYERIGERPMTITHVATRYMPAKEFYAQGQPSGYHPGFDEGAGCALYDCANVNLSFYDWELETAS